MNESFEGKVALVTGAGSGMGLATSKAFAEAGASVEGAAKMMSKKIKGKVVILDANYFSQQER